MHDVVDRVDVDVTAEVPRRTIKCEKCKRSFDIEEDYVGPVHCPYCGW